MEELLRGILEAAAGRGISNEGGVKYDVTVIRSLFNMQADTGGGDAVDLSVRYQGELLGIWDPQNRES